MAFVKITWEVIDLLDKEGLNKFFKKNFLTPSVPEKLKNPIFKIPIFP